MCMVQRGGVLRILPAHIAGAAKLTLRIARLLAPLARPKVERGRASIGAGGGTRTLTGLLPTDFLTNYGFRRRAPAFVVGRFCPAPTTPWSFLQIAYIAYESRPQYTRSACAIRFRSPAAVSSAVIFHHCSDAIVPSLIARPS